ncbi:RelA/SpoT family protein [Propionivibrio limicola]|uniref:RelA/SpoT family protein n=1 Tax=Propionivibrio limicola TaxID=167645 RepID=UPI0012912BC2|nr:bifunctional (p)ppGpp synthetase/guanosine-3',5'-bis(diphosphate) 3'-pyrophosphohydrolase [Propionivibrio limicola]
MVSVVHSVAAHSGEEHSLQTLVEGLSADEAARVRLAAEFAQSVYGDRNLGSGEGIWHHGLGMALIVAGLRLDADCRLAALLFAVPASAEHGLEQVEKRFGRDVAHLVEGVSRLNLMRPISRGFVAHSQEGGEHSPAEMKAQIEIMRKMFLAMVEDIRVVLLRLASRTQTLRHYADNADELRVQVARETLELYSPLANRLGVWELKWELEDRSFHFIHPDIYKKIAKQLDEKRGEREQFIANAVARLRSELEAAGIKHAEIYGRPKHIYSIWNKMRKKGLEFSEVYDVRALRIIVDEVKDCYTALGLVHNIWSPIPKEFDDYISNPKGNNYRSLHTAVSCPDGRALEVQIRTREMHKHAELGVAAHWRYKEGSHAGGDGNYDDKIAWLRQLLTWKDEVSDSSDWVKHYKEAALDETIYVMTPQGRVVDLPRGATPVDFAYRVHTDLGHRCRGAKVDGALVTLNTQLETGQRVEIVAAKQGGPSRDWLNASLGYLFTHRARAKVRQWFSSLALEQSVAEGRAIVNRELQRMGETGAKLDDIASKLGFTKSDDLFIAVARAEVGVRQIQTAVRGAEEHPLDDKAIIAEAAVAKSKSGGDSGKGILIVGVDKLLTQLAGCCKPAPPDPIVGFVTRGKGVSIHRADCPNFANMEAMQPERVIETAWGGETGGLFAVDIIVEANDRQGLLRDVSEVLTREKINVIAVSTQSKQGEAHMRFTGEIANLAQLKRTLAALHEVNGVVGARRA